MPVTRSDLYKSIEAAKLSLGFTETDSVVNKLLLNRNVKRVVNDGLNLQGSWLKLSQSVLLLLKECVTLPREKTEDFLFYEMIEQSSIDEANGTIQLILTGLKSICHSRLCKVLLKRFPQITKPKKIIDLQLQVNNINIPHNPKGKGLVVPPIHIIVNSLPTSFQLSVVGGIRNHLCSFSSRKDSVIFFKGAARYNRTMLYISNSISSELSKFGRFKMAIE